jgi:FlaA1/EpsC-like NDP-sugar epimerase
MLKKFTASRLVLADLIVISAAVIGSFALRLNLEQLILDYIPTVLVTLVAALLIKPWVFRRFGLYERVWAYASIEEMKLIVRTVSLASLLLSILIFSLHFGGLLPRLPRSVLVIDWLASLAAVGALRFGLRLLAENASSAAHTKSSDTKRILVIGAGDAGALVVRELQKNPQLGLSPIAFLDDDVAKVGHKIHTVPVVGILDDLAHQAAQHQIDEVIIAIPSAPGQVLRKVTEICREHNLSFRTMPGLYELVGGTVSVSRLRPVDIADLLRRKPALTDRQRVAESIKGQRIMLTGAGGSIASELCRQLARWGPKQLILLGHGENSIFDILLELRTDFPNIQIEPIIADVRDLDRVKRILQRFQPNILFHAAAHKHVPLMEINPGEAVTNNILGTRNVVQAASDAGVQRLVMISTDKAVQPSSVMGATKRIAEWIVINAAEQDNKEYSVVRFGNVLGSRGSIIPIFEKQIAAGGPVTVTHPDAERYFMTIPEAVHLVLQASTFDQQGQVYMLNMGDPIRISDLAEDLIRLSGLEPGEDIEIVFNGLRPGDKLSEELWEPGADYEQTENPDISKVSEEVRLSGAELQSAIETLVQSTLNADHTKLLNELSRILPSSELGKTSLTDLTSHV